MANGINYSGSNQLLFTVNDSNVLTLASGSGVNFNIPITSSGLFVTSSTTTSSLTIMAKDNASNARMEFPLGPSTGSFLIETLSGTGDFHLAFSSSVHGVKPFLKAFRGGTYGISRVSLMTNNVETFVVDDTGSIFFGNQAMANGAHKWDANTGRFGIRTTSPNAILDVNGSTLISGNLIITGAVGVGITSIPTEKLVVSGNIVPSTDDWFDLGTTNFKWDDVYATNGTIITSDRDLKTDIRSSSLGIDFINSLKPVSYKFINGNSGRTHYGLIAQEVEEVLNNNKVNISDFAGLTISNRQIPKDVVEEHKILDHELKERTEYITKTILVDDPNKKYNYGLRYNEFISPIIKAVQQLSQKLEELENKLSSSKV